MTVVCGRIASSFDCEIALPLSELASAKTRNFLFARNVYLPVCLPEQDGIFNWLLLDLNLQILY